MLNFEGRIYNMAEWSDEMKNLFQNFLAVSAMRERQEDVYNKAAEDFRAAKISHEYVLMIFKENLKNLPSEEADVSGEDND
jgi:hypothetical protein